MAGRTITFTKGIEEGIWEKQIEMMRREKRNVPFSEALNWLILQGLYWGAEHGGMPLGELRERVQQWIRGLEEINEDDFFDRIRVSQEGDWLKR